MRALTGLNQAGKAILAAQQQNRGKPNEMPLNQIMRDPNNPRPPLHQRTPEEQQKQRELNANIKKRGVKSPISLRPHPTIPDRWIINHGHSRYDAAEAAPLPTIPYFIDHNFDSYDQVAENLHRADLSPWAIAEFIKRKLGEGQTKGQIAERLGKENESYITEHLALVDAPNCVHQAYKNGVRSTRTLYDLRRAYEEFPERIESWCNADSKVTRNTIQELLWALRYEGGQQAISSVQPADPALPEFRHDEKIESANVGEADQSLPGAAHTEFCRDCETPPSGASPFPFATDVEQVKTAPDNPSQTPATAAYGQVESAPVTTLAPEKSALEFRHDEKTASCKKHQVHVTPPSSRLDGDEILVQYQGKTAKFAPNATV